MRIFAVVPLIFAVMNAYVFWRLRVAFGPGRWVWAALPLFAFMVWLFSMRRSVIGTPYENVAHWVSLLWVGFVLIAVTWLLFLDAARILAWLLDHAAGTEIGHALRPSRSVPLVLALCLVLACYAFYEATAVRTRHVTVSTRKLPPGVTRLRVTAISDVHINALARKWRLETMAAVVRATQPDILVSLGDLTDTNMDGKTAEAALLRSLKPHLGAYAVLGNHERYSGSASAIRFTNEAGFCLLRSRATEVGGIVIAGVDDPVFLTGRKRRATETKPSEDKSGKGSAPAGDDLATASEQYFLQSLRSYRQAGKFILFLRHRPGEHYRTPGLFDLQLSGHTHGGQIWPAKYLVKRANGNVDQGLTRVTDGINQTLVYVSNGTGFWGPPMRLFTPPEVTVVDLIPEP